MKILKSVASTKRRGMFHNKRVRDFIFKLHFLITFRNYSISTISFQLDLA